MSKVKGPKIDKNKCLQIYKIEKKKKMNIDQSNSSNESLNCCTFCNSSIESDL